jgi:hypothetical protein
MKGLIVGITILIVMWIWVMWPESPKLAKLNNDIERLEAEGIPVIEGKLDGKVVRELVFDYNLFLARIKEEKARVIIANIERTEGKVKYFSVLNNGDVIEFDEVFGSVPSYFLPSSINKGGILFEKDYSTLISTAVILTCGFGVCYGLWVYSRK